MQKKNLFIILLMNALVACGGGGGEGADTLVGKQATYAIGGTLRLADTAPDQIAPEVTLVNRLGGRSVTLRATGPFTFDSLASGTSYEIYVPINPSGFSCDVLNGNSRIDSAPKNDIEVVCTAGAYSVRGVVTGLGVGNPGLQIGNDSQSLSVDSDGPFSFSVRNGVGYRIHIATPHSHYMCELRNSTSGIVTEIAGTINAADISGINVSCAAPIGVRVIGLPPVTPSVQITNTHSVPGQADGVENLFVDRAGDFAFSTPLPSGHTFRINVAVQHPDYDCTAPTTQMTVGAAPVLVNVTCIERVYAVGGSVSGLTQSSTGLELRLSSGVLPIETIAVAPPSSGTTRQFSFNTQLPTRAPYEISVVGEPIALVCDFVPAGSNSGQVNRAIVALALECRVPDPLNVTGVQNSDTPLVPGATNFPLTGAATILFSSSIDATTASSSAISLTGPYGVHATNLSVSGNSVTVRPVGKLVPLTNYTLAVETTIRGTRKQSLQARFTRGFTTGNGWGTADLVSVAAGNPITSLSPQQLIVDQAGNAFGLWSWSSFALGGRVTEVYRFGIRERAWGAHQQFWPTVSGFHIAELFGFVASDQLGNATLAWGQHESGPNYTLQTKRFSSDLEQWSSNVTLRGPGPHAHSAQIRVAANGDAVVIWQQANGSLSSLRTSYYDAGANLWSDPHVLSDSMGTGPAYLASLEMDQLGNAIVVWSNIVGSTSQVYASRFDASSRSWSPSQPIDPSSSQTYMPKVVVGGDGGAIAIWSQAIGTSFAIYLSRFNADTRLWDLPRDIGGVPQMRSALFVSDHRINPNGQVLVGFRISDSNYANAVYTSSGSVLSGLEPARAICSVCSVSDLAIDNNGNTIVVTSESDYQTSWLTVRRSRVGESWQPASRLDTAGPRNARGAQLATDSSGNVISVWLQEDPNNVMNVFARYFSVRTNAWGIPQSIEDNVNSINGVKIGVDSHGNATVIWSDQTSFYSNRFE